MLKVVREIVSDIAISIRHILSGVFLLAGFNVCIAIAAFFTSLLMADPGSGVIWFYAVMGFHGTDLNEPIRQTIEIFNWCAFGGMFVFTAFSFYQYCTTASRRPTAKVIPLPVRREVEAHDTARVANL